MSARVWFRHGSVAARLCAAVFIAGRLSACAGQHASGSSSAAWYTQIGAWHVVRDCSITDAHLYHGARVDGARSGAAISIVRYNLPFTGLTRFGARMTQAPASSRSGILVKNSSVGYYFFVARNTHGDSVICLRRAGKADSVIAAFALGRDPALRDTAAHMRIEIVPTSQIIALSAGTWRAAIARPWDFPEPAIIGFVCLSGTVRVWEAEIESDSGVFIETFDAAPLFNLHMERTRRKAKSRG